MKNTRSDQLMRAGLALLVLCTLLFVIPDRAYAGVHDLVLESRMVNITGTPRLAMMINGQIPGPVLRLKEGEKAVINVTNRLDETTSIHWHGLILPAGVDGVPNISPQFYGIKPGETYTYRFTVRQSGTYWFHSHTGSQEQLGIYAPIIIEPRAKEPYRYDRDYIIMLSDWTNEDPQRIVNKLKVNASYYNYSRQTLVSLFRELGEAGTEEERQRIVSERLEWQRMRMDPTDITDVGGYTFLVNGLPPEQNFTALFRPGERVRLRFINGSAASYYDVRIPGLKMTLVQADGNNVVPVRIDEFRIAVAETYDVIIQPMEDKAYTIAAEAVDRTGFARATLATRPGMIGELPPHRPRAILTMADMSPTMGPTGLDRGTLLPEEDMPGHVPPMSEAGMSGMKMDGSSAPAATAMPGMKMDGKKTSPAPSGGLSGMGAMNQSMPGMKMDGPPTAAAAMPGMKMDGKKTSPAPSGGMPGMGKTKQQSQSMPGMEAGSPDPLSYDTGAPPGTRVLSYRDLKALNPYPYRPYDRIIEIRLTGNMQRYFWSINGRKFSEAQPITLRLGERARFRFINETMMSHPMHIHGTWMLLDNGNGKRAPKKHVVNIKPGATVDVDIPADAEGPWAFHCHILYHMDTGMMRQVNVVRRAAASTR